MTSLSTVVRMVTHDGQLRIEWEDIRTVQATIAETKGWSSCPADLMQRIAFLSEDAAVLTLAHAQNLLSLCENCAGKLCNNSSSSKPCSTTSQSTAKPAAL